MEDELLFMMTFDGRRALMEDSLLWKTIFDGKRPLMENEYKSIIKFNPKPDQS